MSIIYLIGLLLLLAILLTPLFIIWGRKNNAPIIIIWVLSLIFFLIGCAASSGAMIIIGLSGFFVALIWAVSSPKKTKEQMKWTNTCNKCGFAKEFNQPLKIYKCPQCGFENVNSETTTSSFLISEK